MSVTPLLSIDNISCGYGAITVLKDVSLSIHPGEIVTLLGANGAGKSTLLMSLFSNPRISSGTISFKNHHINTLQSADIAKLGITIVPEGRRIFQKMQVEENILLGAWNQTETDQSLLDDIYQMFPILKSRRQQTAGTLSGGEQQMLAIARALMSKPKLMLLDEPSLGLAPKIIQQIFEILGEIKNQGTTLFLVEQNANLALKLANRGYVLANGQIHFQGSSEELLSSTEIKQAYLGG